MKFIRQVASIVVLSVNFFSLGAMDDSTHTNSPKKNLELAESGHVEAMVPIIRGALMASGHIAWESKSGVSCPWTQNNNEKQKNFKIALQWFARYHIRMIQDAACCYDANMVPAMQNVIQQQEFVRSISRNISPEELNKVYLQELPWVEQKTMNNALPEPCHSINTLRDLPVHTIIPQEKWQEARHSMLEHFQHSFSH